MVPLKNMFQRFNWQLTLMVVLIILPVALVGYLGYKIYRAYHYQATYTVDFRDENFKNTDRPLYINEDPTSPKFGMSVVENDQYYKQILGSPISFVWRPEEYPLNKKVTVSATIKDEGDWQISLVCPNCEKGKQFDWKPFYYGKLKNYTKAATFDGVNIYVKEPIANPLPADNLKDWMEKNVPHGTSVQIYDNVVPKSWFVNKQYEKESPKSRRRPTTGSGTTVITNTLRGPHEFYVVLDGKLDLTVTKKDLNNYEGADDVLVSLYDMDDNKLFQDYLPDDGNNLNKTITKNNKISRKYIKDLPKNGIYKLVFSEKEGTEIKDWVITYLKINSSKIILSNRSLILDSATLFSSSFSIKNIGILVWHENAIQNIEISTDSSVNNYSIGTEDLSQNKQISLQPNKIHTIKVQGDQYLDGAYLAFNKNNIFEPYIYDIENIVDPTIIITKQNPVLTANGYTTISYTIPKKDLEKNSSNDFGISIKNLEKEKMFKDKNNFINNGFSEYSTFDKYILYKKNYLGSLVIQNANNYTEWLLNTIPDGSELKNYNSKDINRQNFINNSLSTNDNKTMHKYSLNLRGSHDFYVYLNANITANIFTTDLNNYLGSDSVTVNLSDLSGNTVCKTKITDDGNTSTNKVQTEVNSTFICNVNPGIYILRFIEDSNNMGKLDFAINTIEINADKFIIKDKALFLRPNTVYISTPEYHQIEFNYWHNGNNQTIKVSNQSDLELTKDDRGKNVSYFITEGLHSVTFEKGDLWIKNTNIATTPDSWFTPYFITLSNDIDAEYLLYENSKNNLGMSFINELSINVE